MTAWLGVVSRDPLEQVRGRLELTSTPSWGHQLRRGLLMLTEADFATLRSAMTAVDQ